MLWGNMWFENGDSEVRISPLEYRDIQCPHREILNDNVAAIWTCV